MLGHKPILPSHPILAGALLIGGGLIYAISAPGGTATRKDAVDFIRSCVEDSLICPGSAKFPDNDYREIKEVARKEGATCGAFALDSYVDAQNPFGALMRKKYSTIVLPPDKTPDGGWKMLYLIFDDGGAPQKYNPILIGELKDLKKS